LIPRGTMAKIYAECFMLDQQIERQGLKRMADTCFVYGAVLDKYGFTVEDLWFSQEKYIKDANRYTRMLKKSVGILEKEKKELMSQKRIQEEQENAEEYRKRFMPNRVYLLDTLDLEHIMEFEIQEGLDTLWRGPLMVVPADSLVVPADSLAKTDATL